MNRQTLLQNCGKKLTFGRLFLTTAIVLVGCCVIGTLFVLPRIYASSAKVLVTNSQAGNEIAQAQVLFEQIKSEKVLAAVVKDLNLTRALAAEAHLETELSPEAARERLKQMMLLRQQRNSALVDIEVFTKNPVLSAAIANKIAETLRTLQGVGDLVDRAQPSRRPIRPNIPMNLVLGSGLSLLVALILAGLVRLLLRRVGPSASPAA